MCDLFSEKSIVLALKIKKSSSFQVSEGTSVLHMLLQFAPSPVSFFIFGTVTLNDDKLSPPSHEENRNFTSDSGTVS